MAITPGTRLGPYEVTVQIGVGGMGEVYRATDTNLKRSVAIKVLPTSVAADAERLARFQREAEILAALNHPNIAAIYGLERSGATTALVMELVEGPTLADRIAQGAIPLDEALPIAKQVAEALEAAHEQGVIHRDLKPANIKVRSDGTVKVLDFGLAKAMEPTGAMSPSASTSPTITTPAMTQAGMILGTAAYMSPEQARGKTVDRRTDIWAFGCVLYEMLTGRRAFDGETTADTVAAILIGRVDWTALPTATPAHVGRLLQRCLEIDLRRRARDSGDVAADLATAPLNASSPPSPRRHHWLEFVLGLVAVALVVVAFRAGRAAAPPSVETRVDIVTAPSSEPASFAIAPDGRTIAFVASNGTADQIWLRSLDTNTSRVLAGTEDATFPFWSPDGRSVAFFAQRQLKRIDLGPGSVQALAAVEGGRGGAWSSRRNDRVSGVARTGADASNARRRRHAIGAATARPVPAVSARWPTFPLLHDRSVRI